MSNPFAEMLQKTGVSFRCLVTSGINEYTKKPTTEDPNPKTYFSVDVLIQDHKNAIKVNLPEHFDRSKLVIGELLNFPIQIREFKNGGCSFNLLV